MGTRHTYFRDFIWIPHLTHMYLSRRLVFWDILRKFLLFFNCLYFTGLEIKIWQSYIALLINRDNYRLTDKSTSASLLKMIWFYLFWQWLVYVYFDIPCQLSYGWTFCTSPKIITILYGRSSYILISLSLL